MAIFNEKYIQEFFFNKNKEVNFIAFYPHGINKEGSELNHALFKNEPNTGKEAFIKHIKNSVKIQGNKLIIPYKERDFYNSDKYLSDMIKVKAILNNKNEYTKCILEEILDTKSYRQYAKNFGFKIEFENSINVDEESKIRKTEITKILKIAKDTLKLTNSKFDDKISAYVLNISDEEIQDFINCEEDYTTLISGSMISEEERLNNKLDNMSKNEYIELINRRWETEEFLINTIKKNVKSDSSIRGRIDEDADKHDFIIEYVLK